MLNINTFKLKLYKESSSLALYKMDHRDKISKQNKPTWTEWIKSSQHKIKNEELINIGAISRLVTALKR